jgi:hypothetical protein
MNHTRKSLADLTSNEYWGGLNRRFDRRISILAKCGIRNVGGTGWASRREVWTDGQRKPYWVMSAQFVMHADHRAWNELLADLVR